jgi:hypothetical protein
MKRLLKGVQRSGGCCEGAVERSGGNLILGKLTTLPCEASSGGEADCAMQTEQGKAIGGFWNAQEEFKENGKSKEGSEG